MSTASGQITLDDLTEALPQTNVITTPAPIWVQDCGTWHECKAARIVTNEKGETKILLAVDSNGFYGGLE